MIMMMMMMIITINTYCTTFAIAPLFIHKNSGPKSVKRTKRIDTITEQIIRTELLDTHESLEHTSADTFQHRPKRTKCSRKITSTSSVGSRSIHLPSFCISCSPTALVSNQDPSPPNHWTELESCHAYPAVNRRLGIVAQHRRGGREPNTDCVMSNLVSRRCRREIVRSKTPKNDVSFSWTTEAAAVSLDGRQAHQQQQQQQLRSCPT